MITHINNSSLIVWFYHTVSIGAPEDSESCVFHVLLPIRFHVDYFLYCLFSELFEIFLKGTSKPLVCLPKMFLLPASHQQNQILWKRNLKICISNTYQLLPRWFLCTCKRKPLRNTDLLISLAVQLSFQLCPFSAFSPYLCIHFSIFKGICKPVQNSVSWPCPPSLHPGLQWSISAVM